MATKTLTQEEQFVSFVLEHITDSMKDIDVERSEDDLGILLKINAPGSEIGKIKGKNSRHIEAMKTLLNVIRAKGNLPRISLKIVEKE